VLCPSIPDPRFAAALMSRVAPAAPEGFMVDLFVPPRISIRRDYPFDREALCAAVLGLSAFQPAPDAEIWRSMFRDL